MSPSIKWMSLFRLTQTVNRHHNYILLCVIIFSNTSPCLCKSSDFPLLPFSTVPVAAVTQTQWRKQEDRWVATELWRQPSTHTCSLLCWAESKGPRSRSLLAFFNFRGRPQKQKFLSAEVSHTAGKQSVAFCIWAQRKEFSWETGVVSWW